MTQRDWIEWHAKYGDPTSEHSRRLGVIRDHIRATLDAAPAGPIRVLSMCAGDGRDLLGVLPGHPRRPDVTGRLVELHPQLVARGREAAAGTGIEVVRGDAGMADQYAGAVPADLVLVCGVFGNITDADVAGTIAALPQFTAPGATVIWTRHRDEPDLVPAITQWFAAHGFELVSLSPKEAGYGVGVQRFTGEPQPLRSGSRLFTFTHSRGT